MEVVKTSLDNKNDMVLYDVICQHCNSVIHFSRGEALTINPSLTAEYMTIMCPTCITPVVKVVNKKIDEREVGVSKFVDTRVDFNQNLWYPQDQTNQEQ